MTHGTAPGSWYELTKGRDGGRTTQRPSVICIGPAGENLARVSCIVHDAGHVTGQSGFGAVFGAKNLKAMSFIGSKSIPIADPAALVRLRLEVQEKFGYDIDAGKVPGAPGSPGAASTVLDTSPTVSRAEGCRGCFKNCRNLYPGGVGNELTCSAGLYFTDSGKIDEQLAAYSLLSKLGLNGYEIDMPVYLHNLYKMGVMGKGKDIDTDLPFEQYGTYAFIEELLMRIAYRREIGDDLAEGIARAAQKWGRWDEDTSSGLLARPNWGYCEHNEPRAEVEWSYGSIFSERDINEHGVHNAVYNTSIMAVLTGAEPPVSAENMAKQLADQSGLGDPLCFDWSEEAGSGSEGIPGMAEACRRFPLPSPDEAAHALRELSWGEHFVAGRMVPSKGGSDLYLYNLHSAAVFLLDRDEARVGKGADQIIKLIDVDAFVAWLRDTVGDAALADAIARECPADDPYRDRLENVQRLLALRMVQYGAASDAMNAADAEQDEGA